MDWDSPVVFVVGFITAMALLILAIGFAFPEEAENEQIDRCLEERNEQVVKACLAAVNR